MDIKTEKTLQRFDSEQVLQRLNAGPKTEIPSDRFGFQIIRVWWKRYRDRTSLRQDLEAMTPETLRDFGLTRAQARTIAYTPFWRDVSRY